MMIEQADALVRMPELPAEHYGCVIADPPYSSGTTHAAGRTTMKPSVKYQNSENHGIYPEFAGDNRDQRSFAIWSERWMREAYRVTRPGGLILCFSDWRQLPATTDALQVAGWIWRGIAVWDKTGSARPQRGRFKAQSEFIAWGSRGHLPNEGRCAPGVFRHSVGNRKNHITAKPTALFEDLLQIAQPPVLDPFAGGGSLGIACKRLGFDYHGLEIDPHFAGVAMKAIEAGVAMKAIGEAVP
ncbi:MAG: DNA methyltransferase [Geminicoccaceae bacterium]